VFTDIKEAKAFLKTMKAPYVLKAGDKGPNTGGMGAYSPTPVFTQNAMIEVMEKIIQPTVYGMAKDGHPFKGVLFAGLMMTADGPKLIEYNARFGDPECQVIMRRLHNQRP